MDARYELAQGGEPLTYAIDFGTSNSLLAAASPQASSPPIPLQQEGADPSILRSILYTPSPGTWYFGDEAVRNYGSLGQGGRIFRSLKKFLPDPAFTGTRIHDKAYSLIDLIALFLKEMRERANAYFQQEVSQLLLGKPAVYSLDQERDKLACQRMEAAAKMAGFKDIRFCPEPLAAAYEFRSQLAHKQTVLVADFGGGPQILPSCGWTVRAFKPQTFWLSMGFLWPGMLSMAAL